MKYSSNNISTKTMLKRSKTILAYLIILTMLLCSCGEAYKDSSASPAGGPSGGSQSEQSAKENGDSSAKEQGAQEGSEGQKDSQTANSSEEAGTEGSIEENSEPADDGRKTTGFIDAPEGYFENVLFIGDSRCEGLRKYGGIEGPDWFTDVGLSVFNIKDKAIAMEEGAEPVDLETVLSSKKYDAVYIGLGINELGYDISVISSRFSDLIELVRSSQEDAVIFLMANIHVTAARSESDEIYNNERIEELNTAISMFADFDTIYYIDVNPLFDDGGALDGEKSFDDVHIFAKHYPEWSDFLRAHAVVLKERAQ
ncbi:MAG: hypothetical protein II971_00885 [Firmicutes bacterium]|nr:hypothetical protein [Bacillota bacterium]